MATSSTCLHCHVMQTQRVKIKQMTEHQIQCSGSLKITYISRKVPLTFIVFTTQEMENGSKYCSVCLLCRINGVCNSLDHSNCNRCPVMVQAVINMRFCSLIFGDFYCVCLNMLQSSWPECTKQSALWVSLQLLLMFNQFYKIIPSHCSDFVGTITVSLTHH